MKYIFSLVLLSFSLISSAQKEIKDFVKKNTLPINNIDPNSVDYSDLEVIGNAIHNSRIVMLGEQDHGDATTFLAKTKLIKYLHEKKGFNVLAFESDFFAFTKGWEELPKEKHSIITFLQKNIQSVWTKCDATSNLFYEYIPSTFNTERPLQVTGFDNILLGDFSKNYLLKNIDSLLQSNNIFNKDNYLQAIENLFSSYTNYKQENPEYYSLINGHLKNLYNILADKKISQYWLKIIESLIVLNERAINTKGFNIGRDKQMAENLLWLVRNNYKNEKIIVWAANAHIIKYEGIINYSKRVAFPYSSMGINFVKNYDPSKVYIIGFDSFAGTTTRLDAANQTYKIAMPEKNSFERWIPDSIDFGFLDFKQYNNSNPPNETFHMKIGLFNKSMVSDWNKSFDGIFFIRNMYPCKPIQ